MLSACILSAFGRFSPWRGFCAFVRLLPAVPGSRLRFPVGFCIASGILYTFGSFSGFAALLVSRSGFIFGPLWAFISFCGFLFACGPSVALWAFPASVLIFFGSLAAVPLLGVVIVWKFCPVLGFGYGLPVVFSASFWDPLRLLLFSGFKNSRRRVSFPVSVLRVGFYNFALFRVFFRSWVFVRLLMFSPFLVDFRQ